MLNEAKSDSPTAFKLLGLETAALATLQYNADYPPHIGTASMQKLPEMISLWEQCLAQLIKDKAPAELTCDLPIKFLNGCESDEPTMNLVIAAIDQAYNEADSDVATRVLLDGEYFTEMAWAARGSDYANTVSDSQFHTFDDRLVQARKILEDAYAKYPNEPVFRAANSGRRGGSMDRATMELWFQRAVKNHSDFFKGYAAKEWYLQPALARLAG